MKITSVKKSWFSWRSYIVYCTDLQIMFKKVERWTLNEVLACLAYSWKRAPLYQKKESVDEEKIAFYWYSSRPLAILMVLSGSSCQLKWTFKRWNAKDPRKQFKRIKERKSQKRETETEWKPKKKINIISFTPQPSCPMRSSVDCC